MKHVWYKYEVYDLKTALSMIKTNIVPISDRPCHLKPGNSLKGVPVYKTMNETYQLRQQSAYTMDSHASVKALQP